MQISIINGPNLNLLGIREKDIYGLQSLKDLEKNLRAAYPGPEFHFFQSNVEGEIINEIQRAGFSSDGIILNPGGYTHTSVAIGDAVAAVPAPVLEVHISNIFAREEFRKTSLVSPYCTGLISGLGLQGYYLAVEYFLSKLKNT